VSNGRAGGKHSDLSRYSEHLRTGGAGEKERHRFGVVPFLYYPSDVLDLPVTCGFDSVSHFSEMLASVVLEAGEPGHDKVVLVLSCLRFGWDAGNLALRNDFVSLQLLDESG
jgi:hypothetical protein